MPKQREFSAFPQRFFVNTAQHDSDFVYAEGYYAIHDWHEEVAESAPLLLFEDEAIAVFPGTPSHRNTDEVVTPVYRLGPSGALAVPTGRVLVRFQESINAAAKATSIEQAGYTIDQVLEYAPNVAWVTAHSGKVADALDGLTALAALPGVEQVEPQMLMQRASRSSR